MENPYPMVFNHAHSEYHVLLFLANMHPFLSMAFHTKKGKKPDFDSVF